ncbi:hypothetical protein CYMTET_27899, partial [Cymbomonas tetramitiformis]
MTCVSPDGWRTQMGGWASSLRENHYASPLLTETFLTSTPLLILPKKFSPSTPKTLPSAKKPPDATPPSCVLPQIQTSSGEANGIFAFTPPLSAPHLAEGPLLAERTSVSAPATLGKMDFGSMEEEGNRLRSPLGMVDLLVRVDTKTRDMSTFLDARDSRLEPIPVHFGSSPEPCGTGRFGRVSRVSRSIRISRVSRDSRQSSEVEGQASFRTFRSHTSASPRVSTYRTHRSGSTSISDIVVDKLPEGLDDDYDYDYSIARKFKLFVRAKLAQADGGLLGMLQGAADPGTRRHRGLDSGSDSGTSSPSPPGSPYGRDLPARRKDDKFSDRHLMSIDLSKLRNKHGDWKPHGDFFKCEEHGRSTLKNLLRKPADHVSETSFYRNLLELKAYRPFFTPRIDPVEHEHRWVQKKEEVIEDPDPELPEEWLTMLSRIAPFIPEEDREDELFKLARLCNRWMLSFNEIYKYYSALDLLLDHPHDRKQMVSVQLWQLIKDTEIYCRGFSTPGINRLMEPILETPSSVKNEQLFSDEEKTETGKVKVSTLVEKLDEGEVPSVQQQVPPISRRDWILQSRERKKTFSNRNNVMSQGVSQQTTPGSSHEGTPRLSPSGQGRAAWSQLKSSVLKKGRRSQSQSLLPPLPDFIKPHVHVTDSQDYVDDLQLQLPSRGPVHSAVFLAEAVIRMAYYRPMMPPKGTIVVAGEKKLEKKGNGGAQAANRRRSMMPVAEGKPKRNSLKADSDGKPRREGEEAEEQIDALSPLSERFEILMESHVLPNACRPLNATAQ